VKVFLSWSGKKSSLAAQLFSEWLPCVIQKAQPWISSKDIDRGSVWLGEIYSQLAESNQGVIFVTKENQIKPWLLYEAGALSKGISENRVCTFLVDLNVRDIESSSPLSHLNHTSANKEQIFELIKTINKCLQDEAVPDGILIKSFEALWPEFSKKLDEIKAISEKETIPERHDEDVLNDILENVLNINRKISRQSSLGNRYISGNKASEIIKILMASGLEKETIYTVLSDLTPSEWLKHRLFSESHDEIHDDFERISPSKSITTLKF